MRFIILLGVFSCSFPVIAQIDTTQIEVISITSKAKLSTKKTLGSVEEQMLQAPQIDFIRRGSYAWEPLLNGFSSERTALTIDGMAIHAACTDKMDPVTSYVEISNLSNISIGTGNQTSAGIQSIAGSVNLNTASPLFADSIQYKNQLFAGLESGNWQKIVGYTNQFSSQKWFTKASLFWRDGENYTAGKRTPISYSSFSKLNTSLNTAYRINSREIIELKSIFDYAYNVGYPALTMDVKKAQAIILSIDYSKEIDQNWKLVSKIYFNKITHIMDDSKRPDVPIRMDMPGWSTTAGYLISANYLKSKHRFLLNSNGHWNYSIAEMTMYPNDPNEKEMFMYTWPKVHSWYQGFQGEWNYKINTNQKVTVQSGIHFQHRFITDSVGLNTVQIIDAEFSGKLTKVLPSVSASWDFYQNNWNIHFKSGYSTRAASVSEAFGFYLFNANDRYDYIGNIRLKNEKALYAELETSKAWSNFKIQIRSNYFYTLDYIIGEINPDYYVMTIGAIGVKNYQNISPVAIQNNYLSFHYFPIHTLKLGGTISSHLQQEIKTKQTLPFTSPIRGQFEIRWTHQNFFLGANVQYHFKQQKFGKAFGESNTSSWTLLNVDLGHSFQWKKQQILIKAGVHNLFDRYYTSYSDWQKIPRMGRNIFLHLEYQF